MRDYVELVKALQLCPNTCRGCPRLNTSEPFTECKAKLNRDAADAIEELLGQHEADAKEIEWLKKCVQDLPKPPHWISVEDELPEENKQIISYLAYKGMAVLQYENKHFYMQGAFQPLPKEAVTHWMPLPEPPKGVE